MLTRVKVKANVFLPLLLYSTVVVFVVVFHSVSGVFVVVFHVAVYYLSWFLS